jgi:hypothetical protein
LKERKRLELNLTLCGESAKRARYLKRVLGLESNASLARYLIREAYNRINERE